MKKSNKPISRYVIYVLLGLLFVGLILTAVLTPQIIYGIYDDYQYHLSSKADRNQLDASQLDAIYEKDRGKRLSAYTGGHFLGKRYIAVETEIADEEELDGTIKSLVMELNELLFQTNVEIEQDEIIVNNAAAGEPLFFYYVLGDIIPLSEEMFYMDSGYLSNCVDRSTCRRFMIYEESMSDGIAFSLLYMKINLYADFQIELLGDAYDSTIYYMKIQYPDEFLGGYDDDYKPLYAGENGVMFGRYFQKIMTEYYEADDTGEETMSHRALYPMGCSEDLTFGDGNLAAEIRMWSEGETEAVNRLGIGLRQIADAVGVMEIP